jgi:hypothetical protein
VLDCWMIDLLSAIFWSPRLQLHQPPRRHSSNYGVHTQYGTTPSTMHPAGSSRTLLRGRQ